MRVSRLGGVSVPGLAARCVAGMNPSLVLGLFAALAYGVSDFAAGLGSRRAGVGAVTAPSQFISLLFAILAVAIFPGHGPDGRAILWGGVAGVGAGIGVLALYRGLASGLMGVVATLSAVLAAGLPVLAGILLGEHLGSMAVAGILVALPAIALVSWQPDGHGDARALRQGRQFGIVSGIGFALLFIALARSGDDSSAWPLVCSQTVSTLVVLPLFRRPRGGMNRSLLMLIALAGVLGGAANLAYLVASRTGLMSIAAVLTSLYPAATIILARIVLGERWCRQHLLGFMLAVVAIVLLGMR